MVSSSNISHKSTTKIIWKVFIILSLITLAEVFLGIYKPDFINHNSFLHLSLLNWIFVTLTIFKAFYIMWYFMHLGGEKTPFIISVLGVLIFYTAFFVILVLIEGDYVFDVINNSTHVWKF